MIKKQKYVCYGCGKDRPCFVETNQEQRSLNVEIEDLKCILDETNQTSYKWDYYTSTGIKSKLLQIQAEMEGFVLNDRCPVSHEALVYWYNGILGMIQEVEKNTQARA